MGLGQDLPADQDIKPKQMLSSRSILDPFPPFSFAFKIEHNHPWLNYNDVNSEHRQVLFPQEHVPTQRGTTTQIYCLGVSNGERQKDLP